MRKMKMFYKKQNCIILTLKEIFLIVSTSLHYAKALFNLDLYIVDIRSEKVHGSVL
jgi:hypothetical protein